MLCRVDFADAGERLLRPLSPRQVKKWTECAANGVAFPVSCEPAAALDEDHDLVLIFSNTWQDSPSVPIQSFLKSEAGVRLLGGKPFAVLVICRRCKHRRVLYPARLSEDLGPDFQVIDLRQRLRCSQCRALAANIHETTR